MSLNQIHALTRPPRNTRQRLQGISCARWLILVALIVYISLTHVSNMSAADKPRAWLTDRAFLKELDQPISATWESVNLRTIIRRIEETRRISIVADRRIDPSREISAQASGESVRRFLTTLAAESQAIPSVVGNTVYLGPPAAAGKLRTLVELRKRELLEDSLAVPASRRAELTRPRLWTWHDLDRPVDIVKSITHEIGLVTQGLELIPHDLWAAATLPGMSAAEVLSLVLIQFDLTFTWTDAGRGIQLVEIPERVTVEQTHSPPSGIKAAAALSRWKETYPELEGRIEGGKVVVRGTIELHESIDLSQRPDAKTGAATTSKLKPLKDERYTIRIKAKPVRVLMAELEKPSNGQLVFEYDADQLQAAGINLDEQRITFEVQNATIQQLLKAAFEPLRLTCELSDRTVRLVPKR